MLRTNHTNSGHRNLAEDGSAYVEFLLCLPFIITLIVGIVDIGRGLALYMTLTRLSFEGARYFATIPGAHQTTCSINTEGAHCATTPAFSTTAVDPAILQVWIKLGPLFERTIAQQDKSTVVTQLFGPNNPRPLPGAVLGDAGDQSRSVTVTIRTEFEPMFPTFGLLNSLSASSSGPYLLTNMGS
jgi:Flp pilus assembly protein TadG